MDACKKVCEENGLEPLVAKRSDWYGRIQVATPVIDGVLDPAVYEVINTFRNFFSFLFFCILLTFLH